MFKLISRTAAEKADLAGSWRRPDEEFFSAGACHILAGVFLESYPEANYRAVMLKPDDGFRGGHVIVTDGRQVFDSRGWHKHAIFLQRYTESCRAVYPGWSCTLVDIEDPLVWVFCRAYTHRHPSQFFIDPRERAKAFLSRFSPPPATA